jgi:hypothetical protein
MCHVILGKIVYKPSSAAAGFLHANPDCAILQDSRWLTAQSAERGGVAGAVTLQAVRSAAASLAR